MSWSHQARDLQVGLAVDHRNAADAAVVVLPAHAFIGRTGVGDVTRVGVVAGIDFAVREARVVGVGVGDDVEVEVAADTARQRDLSAFGVARALRQTVLVAVDEGAQRNRPFGQEDRVRRQVDTVDPVARAVPDRAAVVAHGPADRGLLAREVFRRRRDGDHLQIRRQRRDAGIRGADIVLFVALGHVIGFWPVEIQIGVTDNVLAGGGRVEREGRALAVAGAGRGAAIVGNAAQIPGLGTLGVQNRIVGQPEHVVPASGCFTGTAVGHRPVDRQRFLGGRQRRRRERRYLQVRRRRLEAADDVDRARLVVVVVEFVRIVGVEIARQRIFQDDVVGIAPHGHVVGARGHVRRQIHQRRDVVALAHCECAAVLQRAQQDGAVAGGVRTRLVARQPDGVGPRRVARIAGRGTAALVGDGITHLDARAFDRLCRSDHAAGHQVGQRIRLHVQRNGADVVGVVRVLVDRTAAVGLHDQKHVAAVADRNLHAVGRGGIQLAWVERRAVLVAADQQVITGQLVVQRQIHAVAPARRRGRHRPLVDDSEQQRDRGASRRTRRRGDVRHLQVGARQQRDFQRLVIGGGVVAGCGAVLVHRCIRVGDHHRLIDTLGARWQLEAFGAGVGLAGVEAAGVVAEGAEVDTRIIGLADLAHVHRIGPRSVGLGLAVVAHGPLDVDVIALIGRSRGLDVGHLQIRRRRQRDLHRTGDAGIVASVDKLERPESAHAHVVAAGKPVRNRHLLIAAVAVAGGEHAQVGKDANGSDNLGPGGVGGQDDLVVPAGDVSRANAGVGDSPRHVHALAGTGHGRHRCGADDQVRVRNLHHVEDLRRLAGVVGLEAVLEHLAFGVGAHEEMEAALEIGRQQQGFAAAVGLAHGQRTGMHILAHDAVVAVTGDGIDRRDQRVGPGTRAPHAGAVVGHAPADADLRRVANGQRRRHDARCHQLRIVGQRHVDPPARQVVGFRPQFSHRASGVGCHQQEIRPLRTQRQVHIDATAIVLERRQRPGDVVRRQQCVGAVDQTIARQVDPVEPVARRLPGPGVANHVGERDPVARNGSRRRIEQVWREVRMHHLQRRNRSAQVVAFGDAAGRALVDLGRVVGDDDDLVAAIKQRRHVEVEHAGVARPGVQVAGMHDVAQIARAAERVAGRNIDAVGPGALGAAAAGVAAGPFDVHALARRSQRRQRDRTDLQVRQRRRGDGRALKGRSGVVGLEVGLEDAVVGVGAHQKIVVSAQAVGDEHVRRCGVAVANR